MNIHFFYGLILITISKYNNSMQKVELTIIIGENAF
jgi:hypothetical protein